MSDQNNDTILSVMVSLHLSVASHMGCTSGIDKSVESLAWSIRILRLTSCSTDSFQHSCTIERAYAMTKGHSHIDYNSTETCMS